MKVVILAGGLGTRISEETTVKPKPMVEIGDMPILWHIMKSYSAHGLNDFVICLGYKGYVIKDFFANYALRSSSVTYDLRENSVELHDVPTDPWKISLVETGEESMTGGRIKRAQSFIGNETFCLTYGDGVSNVNIKELVTFHKSEKAMVTLTAVQPAGRFGAISLETNNSRIREFKEKPAGDGAWINGGYFVCEPEVFSHIDGDSTVWEDAPLRRIASSGNLCAYRHSGFWHPMDTLRDKHYLETVWQSGDVPWKVWT
jgi:glucose-1-phosphate cytidylyltransferase